MAVELRAGNAAVIAEKVRELSPTVDPAKRQGIVWVDLPQGTPLRSGMFVEGRIVTGEYSALVVPEPALLAHDGYSYVFAVNTNNALSKVTLTRVQSGARQNGRVEILSGLTAGVGVALTGAGFLKNDDVVRVVEAAALNVQPVTAN
jgi:multidrug efflux pump subunit AcrA (membrane-fusion protein)